MNARELMEAYGLKHQPSSKFFVKQGGAIFLVRDYSPEQPRDEKGRFATSNGASDVPNVKEGIRLLRERLEKANTTKEYRSIARGGAALLKGLYGCSLPGMPNTAVYVGAQFVGESGKYYATEKPSRHKELTERLLLMYEHFEDFLRTGARSDWVGGGERHPNSEFCTISKRLVYKSRSIRFTLDIERTKADWKGAAGQAHNSSSEGNPGFDAKAKALNFRKDSAMSMIAVVGFSIE